MNFLSLRAELQNWTLQSDDKLYRAIKELSDTVLEAEKLIMNNIQTTRYEAIRGHVQSGCSYNQYLRISETKFTENKIGEKASVAIKQNNVPKAETKNKMDIFKQAIQIGIKNLEITQQKGGDNDLVSVSDTALSQSIYKDCRVPAFYGTRQFATNSFLNLFTNNELNDQVPTEKFQTNQLVMNNQLQQSEILPPPPPISTVLNQTYSNSNFLPPPPPLDVVLGSASLSIPPPPPPNFNLLPGNLPPPPPLSTISLPVPPSNLPTLPPINNIIGNENNQPPKRVQIDQSVEQASISIAPPSQPRGPLSVQEELALRLKHGKNYKKQIEIKVEEPKPKQVIKVEVNNPTNIIQNNRLPEIMEERESAQINPRSSIRNSYGINLNPLISPMSNNQARQEQAEQEQVDSFFGPAKSKPRETKKMMNIGDDIMRRQTFNEDILFKKKPIPEKKEIVKPKNTLFVDDNEQQSSDFTFKKKEKKEQKKEQIKVKANPLGKEPKNQKKGLLDSESDQDTSALFKKKETKPVVAKTQVTVTQKKPLNPLFKPSEPKQVNVKIEQNKTNTTILQTTNVSQVENLSTQSYGASYAMRAAAAGGQRMGMGMPILPQGMVFTKPSEARKNEEEAIRKIKQREEQEKIARIEQEKRLEVERAQENERLEKFRQQQQEKQSIEQANRFRQEEENRKKQQQLYRLRQQQQKQQEQERVRKIEESKKQKQQTEILQKVTSPQNKATQKRNALFDDQDDSEDVFKPKSKKLNLPPLPVISNPVKPVQQNPKPEVTQKIVVQPVQSGLAVRRNKAKPTLKAESLFDSEQDEVKIKAPVTSLKVSNKVDVAVEKTQSLSYAQKLASRAQEGGPSLPVLPKGMIFAKPSEAKQQENNAIEKLKRQEQEKRKRQEVMQNERLRQESERLKRLQIQRIERERQIEQRRRVEEAELMKRQQLKRKQRQRQLEEQRLKEALRRQQQERQRQRKEQQRAEAARRQQLKRIQEQRKIQELRRIQEQRRIQELRRIQQMRKIQEQKRIEELARIQYERRQLERKQQQAKILQERRRREQIERQQQTRRQREAEEQRIKRQREAQEERRRNEQAKKQSLPFLPKLPTRSNNQPLGGPLTTPSLPKTAAKQPLQSSTQSKKTTLFNDDDEDELSFNKSSKPVPKSKPNVASSTQKRGLFDDDDDIDNSNFLSSKKAVTPKNETTKPNLFHEEEQQKVIIKPANTKIMQSQPVRQPASNKDAGKKKSLFDDDDDLESNTFLKKPARVEQPDPINIPQSSPQKSVLKSESPLNTNVQTQSVQKQQPAKKKGLFDDNDDDEGFLTKKPVPQKSPAPVSIGQKKGLFDDNDDDDGFLKKKPIAQKSPAPVTAAKKETQPKKRNLFEDSD